MTIALSMYSVYKSDDTDGLSDLLEKCKMGAIDIESCGSNGDLKIYEFEDGSQIAHCAVLNIFKVH